MTTCAKPHGSDPWLAASSSAIRGRTRMGGSFVLSATLHGGAVALLVLAAWALREEAAREQRFILVPASAGGGSANSAAVPGEGRVDVATATPDFRTEMVRRQRAEERRAEREIARMREQRRIEEDRQEAATPTVTEQTHVGRATDTADTRRTTSYSEFRERNPLPGSRTAAGPQVSGVPGAHISIGPGTGQPGAGLMSKTSAEAGAMDRYFSELITRLRASHEKPDGLSDLLNAEVEFTVTAGGTVSGVRIVRSSGNADFDRSVLEAFGRVRMSARPDGKTDARQLTFWIREA